MPLHLMTIQQSLAQGGSHWTCSCGMRSARDNLSWNKANRQAKAHEERMARVEAARENIFYSVMKWVLILLAMSAPFYAAQVYGMSAMLLVLGGEVAAVGATIFDHIQDLANERGVSSAPGIGPDRSRDWLA